MALDDNNNNEEPKSAAQLQREIEGQRRRVESTIDEIQEKLSPGQLVDQLMSYSKVGGGEIAANLGKQVAANPLPVALLGISLVWLMSGRASPSLPGFGGGGSRRSEGAAEAPYRSAGTTYSGSYGSRDYAGATYGDEDEGFDTRSYAGMDNAPSDWNTTGEGSSFTRENKFANITGSALQRVGSVTDEAGRRYSEFTDDAGRKFRALTDATGNRAGHFTDEAGNIYHGFLDSAGNAIKEFSDEAGNILAEATGWASHMWQTAAEKLQAARSGASAGLRAARGAGGAVGSALSGARGVMGARVHDARHTMGRAAGVVGSTVQSRATQVGRSMTSVVEEQPLVGGALAFAVGAALGAALPRTAHEDRLMGEAADEIKGQAAHVAGDLYEKGKERAASLYTDVSDKASNLYDQAREKVTQGVEAARDAVAPAGQSGEGEGQDSAPPAPAP